nr:MAG TPA: hypothetical protein [Crassvirales sp.]
MKAKRLRNWDFCGVRVNLTDMEKVIKLMEIMEMANTEIRRLVV